MVLLTGIGRPGQTGEVVARALAARGATLLLVDRDEGRAAARAGELVGAGYAASAYGCDLADAAAVTTLAERVRAEHGDRLDAVVCMAGGFAMTGPVADADLQAWEHQITINLRTALLTTRAFLPFLRRARGALVYFASEAALPNARVRNVSAYAVAKTAVVTLMRAVAAEEAAHGVRANAVAPTSIRTAANERAMGADARYVEREDVANVVAFLCSAEAAAISGQVIPVVPRTV